MMSCFICIIMYLMLNCKPYQEVLLMGEPNTTFKDIQKRIWNTATSSKERALCGSEYIAWTVNQTITGSTIRDQIKGVIGMALEMSGGLSFVFGAQVLDIVDQLLANDKFQ